MNLLFSSVWLDKVWQMNRSAKGLLIISTDLDSFSLADHRQFAKSTKLSTLQLSCYTVLRGEFLSLLWNLNNEAIIYQPWPAITMQLFVYIIMLNGVHVHICTAYKNIQLAHSTNKCIDQYNNNVKLGKLIKFKPARTMPGKIIYYLI